MLKVSALAEEHWVINRSGVSVDAGGTRIRQENSGPRDELQARAKLIATAPDGYRLARYVRGLTERWSRSDSLETGLTMNVREIGELISLATRVLLVTGDVGGGEAAATEGELRARSEVSR